MKRIDLDEMIRLHNMWRRQFVNAFAGGNYADMPLSGHRACTFDADLATLSDDAVPGGKAALQAIHRQFHALASEILELSENGMADAADLLVPELTEASHQLMGRLDELRDDLKVGPL